MLCLACLKAWLVRFQWLTSSLLAVFSRFSMSLRTWEDAARAAWESSLITRVGGHQGDYRHYRHYVRRAYTCPVSGRRGDKSVGYCLFLQLNFRQDSGSEPAASIFSTPGCSAMFCGRVSTFSQEDNLKTKLTYNRDKDGR